MDPFTASLLVGGGLGLLQMYQQDKQFDKAMEEAKRREAENLRRQKLMIAASPWVGAGAQQAALTPAPQRPTSPNSMAPIMQGALQGAQMGQNYLMSQAQTNYYQAMADKMKKQNTAPGAPKKKKDDDWENVYSGERI
jgi:hypothetical protein